MDTNEDFETFNTVISRCKPVTRSKAAYHALYILTQTPKGLSGMSALCEFFSDNKGALMEEVTPGELNGSEVQILHHITELFQIEAEHAVDPERKHCALSAQALVRFLQTGDARPLSETFVALVEACEGPYKDLGRRLLVNDMKTLQIMDGLA